RILCRVQIRRCSLFRLLRLRLLARFVCRVIWVVRHRLLLCRVWLVRLTRYTLTPQSRWMVLMMRLQARPQLPTRTLHRRWMVWTRRSHVLGISALGLGARVHLPRRFLARRWATGG